MYGVSVNTSRDVLVNYGVSVSITEYSILASKGAVRAVSVGRILAYYWPILPKHSRKDSLLDFLLR
jgi:hypothetical protein